MMKKIILLVIIILIAGINSYAQLSFGGVPFSFLNKNTLKDSVPQKILPAVNIPQLLKEDSFESNSKTIPWRFGKDIDVDYNTFNSGKWETLKNGDRLWRLDVRSIYAYSLNFIFNNFFIPKGARLFIYNPSKTTVLGAFTENNNRDDRVFATTIIKGDEAILEYYEPANVKNKGIIQLSKIIHAYKDLRKEVKDFLGSGSCNININCPLGLSWQNEKRSVAMILQGNNTRICTGALINDVKQDGIPYFLTAKHCTDGETLNTWILMFNYESPDCTNIEGLINQTLQGAYLKASDLPSDFSLLRLYNIPPVKYNVFYSGWSAIDIATDSCVVIHHPSGDIKKISIEFDSIVSSDWDTGIPDSHWTVPKYAFGTTERGSSGSPIFNKDHRIIGQLHGGTASCSSITDDNFGKFAYSWDKGTTPDTRLKDWLDPDNTGIKAINGKDFNHAIYNLDIAAIIINTPLSGSICTSSINPKIIIQNYGQNPVSSVDIYYKLDNAAPVIYKWKGLLKYTNFTEVTLSNLTYSLGKHNLIFYTANPNDSTDLNRINDTLKISFTYIEGHKIIITLKTDFYSSETSWDLKDSLNNTILSNPLLAPNSITAISSCIPGGCYIFTVHDSYGDGMCSAASASDTGHVNITSNDSLISSINGCKFDSIATIKFCLKKPVVNPGLEIFKIFPNPGSGLLNIQYYAANNLPADCRIYNVIGQEVAKFHLPSKSDGNSIIDLRSLRFGIYFLSLTDYHGKKNKKIMITRKIE